MSLSNHSIAFICLSHVYILIEQMQQSKSSELVRGEKKSLSILFRSAQKICNDRGLYLKAGKVEFQKARHFGKGGKHAKAACSARHRNCTPLEGTASCEKEPSTTLTRQALREQGGISGRLEVPGYGCASGHLPELDLAELTQRK